MTLNGIDEIIRPNLPKHGTQRHKELSGCWSVRYVDDIVITAPTKLKALEFNKKIKEFLSRRGLNISESKSKIFNLENESFEYLG
jgi:menaquinone-dependent protoporphyrinogen IX oxidase